MNPVITLYRITKELHSLVIEIIQQEQRDEAIEKITSLIDEREQLISEVNPPYTEEERKLGTEIVKMNQFIDGKLELLKNEIQLDITNQKKRKQSTTKYINPYNAGPADGMFFDKKK
ncbi:flagellar protein FliT [Ferdinandcohnia sp. Marseille-Q9671]